MPKYQISPDSLNKIDSIVTSDGPEGEKQTKVSSVITREWERIFTVPPRLAFIVGLVLLGAIFGIEILAVKKNIDTEIYRYLIVLAASLTATSFCSGFTGALNIDLKWLQSTGAIAIFVLVFVQNPFFNADALPEQPNKQPTEQPASVLTSLFGALLPSAYADDTISPEPIKPPIVEPVKEAIGYARVYYPIGVADLKSVAFDISGDNKKVTNKSEVYSYGSVFAAVTNPFLYEQDTYQIQIKYQPALDKAKLEMLVDQLESKGYNINKENIIPDYSKADVSIFIKLE